MLVSWALLVRHHVKFKNSAMVVLVSAESEQRSLHYDPVH